MGSAGRIDTSCTHMGIMTARSLFVIVAADLELVNDEDLEKLITTENFVVALFRAQNCPGCDELESQLLSIREDLVDSLNAWVVKLDSSSLVLNFTSAKQPHNSPSVVFFKHGVPMLYDGPSNEEFMLDTFTQNQEANVVDLNDDSFEHLTQVSSGATTGDWFVLFYRDDCEVCMKFRAKWEYIAPQLKGRTNLARVNILSDGIATGIRFEITKVPTFVFFRQMKMYRYDIPNLDSKALQNFANGWYKNAPAKSVPIPKSPFDELIDRTVFMLKENPWILNASAVLLVLVVVLVGFGMWKSKEEDAKPVKKKSVKKSN